MVPNQTDSPLTRGEMVDTFYPCYTNIETIQSSWAFGWFGQGEGQASYFDSTALHQYLMTVESLVEIFDEQKLLDLANVYRSKWKTIRLLQIFSIYYLSPTPKARPPLLNVMDDQALGTLWESTVLHWYEQYRVASSVFEVILYTQMLNDILWNIQFDPRNPRIQEINLERVQKIRMDIPIVKDDPLNEASMKNVVAKVKAALDPRKYTLVLDDDGSILVKKNYKADLFQYFSNASRLMKLYKDRGRIDDLKPELAKIYFINELIETKYIYNQNMTDSEKRDYKRYSDLRSNVLSSFKTYMTYVLDEDKSFDFNYYYENSPYANVIHLKQGQIRGVVKLIKSLLL